MAPSPEHLLSGTGGWAYLIIAVVLLFEAVPVVGALIPAQLFMLGAGFLAAATRGDALRVDLLIVISFVSLFVADVLSFALGRRFGTHLFDRLPQGLARRVRSLSDSLGEHTGKTMIFGKFLGPARALTPPLAGASRVSWPRFLVYEAIGAFLWVTIMIVVGAFFGASYHVIEKQLGRVSLILVLVLVVAYVTVTRLRAAKKEEQVPISGPPK